VRWNSGPVECVYGVEQVNFERCTHCLSVCHVLSNHLSYAFGKHIALEHNVNRPMHHFTV
jgi:hypothetical protein